MEIFREFSANFELPFTSFMKFYTLHSVFYKVLVPYMVSALNMDTPNIFKSNKFYRHMALHVPEEKQLKR